MTILNFDLILAGQAGTSPQIVLINTDDSLAVISEPGYFNSFIRVNGASIKDPAVFIVGYKSTSTGAKLAQMFNLILEDGNYHLINIQGSGPSGPYLESINNLNDVDNKPASRQNIGVEIGVDVQGWSPVLDEISDIGDTNIGLLAQSSVGVFSSVSMTGTSNKVIVTDGDAAGGANPTFSIPDLLEVAIGITSGGSTVLGFVNGEPDSNYVTLSNGSDPVISADGLSANANLCLSAKGLGEVEILGSGGANAAISLFDSTNVHPFTLGTHNNTGGSFLFPGSNGAAGQGLISSDGLGTMQWTSLLPLTGGTMLGTLVLHADPTSALQAATKQYVDARSSGLKPHADVAAAKTSAFASAAYNNGTAGIGATLTNSGVQAALVVDGYTVIVNDRLLITGQTNPAWDGIYVATNVGSVSANWVLTRAADFNAGGDGNIEQGAFVEVVNGDTEAGSGWLMPTAGPYVVGTTSLAWINIYRSGSYTAGTGIDITSFVISIADVTSPATVAHPASITYNAQGQITASTGAGAPLLAASNLSDLASASTARSNLSLVPGTNVQTQNANLQSLANSTTAAGFASFDSGSSVFNFRSLTSANSTLAITNPAGTAGNPSIIIPNGTNNTLAGYNGSGLFSGVTVGSGLALSSGILSTNGGTGNGQWTTIATISVTGLQPYLTADTTSAPGMDSYARLFVSLTYGRSNPYVPSDRNGDLVMSLSTDGGTTWYPGTIFVRNGETFDNNFFGTVLIENPDQTANPCFKIIKTNFSDSLNIGTYQVNFPSADATNGTFFSGAPINAIRFGFVASGSGYNWTPGSPQSTITIYGQ